MLKQILMIKLLILIMIFSFSLLVYGSNYTMSWDFEIFNDPNARQVALNIAKMQQSLNEEEEDPIESFKEGLERRMYSYAQRNIVDMIFNEDEVAVGEYEVGDLLVKVGEDPQTGEVIIEIINDKTGDSTIVSYAKDEWPTEYSSDY